MSKRSEEEWVQKEVEGDVGFSCILVDLETV
jgi:hypothetical protein